MPNIDREYFKSQYETVLGLLAERRAERDEQQETLDSLNQEVIMLEQLLGSLAQFMAEAPAEELDNVAIPNLSNLGLADAVREVLRRANKHKTARGIRDVLEANGYDLRQKHSNPLASIHGVLKRFVDSGEAEQLEAKGKTFYRWKGFGIASLKQGVTVAEPIGPPELFRRTERSEPTQGPEAFRHSPLKHIKRLGNKKD